MLQATVRHRLQNIFVVRSNTRPLRSGSKADHPLQMLHRQLLMHRRQRRAAVISWQRQLMFRYV